MPSDVRRTIAVLRASHDHLAALVQGLDDDAIVGPSFDSDWTIAQVCSHLGSGAELNLDWARAAVGHHDPLPQEAIQQVWDRWDGSTPRQQVDAMVTADEAHVAALEAYTDDELAQGHLSLFGGHFEVQGSDLARFRIGEHAIHTWDVEVALDPSARIQADAVEVITDGLDRAVPRLGTHQGRPWSLAVRTTGPDRTFVLRSTADGVALEPGEAPDVDGLLELPAEQLVRLCYHRLRDGEELLVRDTSPTAEELVATFPPH
jgi:uncharacterized protein (TIGR03083 family)